MANSDILAQLHDSFGAPREAVVGFVERSVPSRVVNLDRLALGDENEVYRVRLAGGETVYVRIRRPDAGTFDGEVWAMDEARAAGVAVPQIHAVEQIDTAEGSRAAMVMAASGGKELAKLLPRLGTEQRRMALTNVGRTLAQVHSVRTPGVDRPDTDGVWADPKSVLDAFIAERTGQSHCLVSAGLSPSEIDRVIERIGASPDAPAPAEPVLCHGDLHAGHAFINDELDVCAVIDWGLWHGGSAIGDLGTMLMAYEPRDFAAILAGHGGQPDAQDFRRRLALSVINQAVGHIAWHESIGNAGGTAHYVGSVRSALMELDRLEH